MVTAARLGESGGRLAWTFPSCPARLARAAAVCVLLTLVAWAVPGRAAELYRCSGAAGETVFTSQTQGYSGCKAITAPSSGTVSTVRAPVVAPADTRGPRLTARTASDTAPAPVRRGSWDYRQSEGSTAPSAPAVPSGARVLRGAVYRVTRADGSVEYTNRKPRRHADAVKTLFTYIATCVACDIHSTIDWNHVPLHLTAFARAIRGAASEYGVNPALLRAVIHAESAFNVHAMSSKGAQGLMQLMPGTATDMGVTDAFDAVQNIRGGARYLAQLLKTFGNDEQLAAAAYNAGPAAVARYNGVPPYAETQVYVQRVATLRKRYSAATASASLAGTGPG